MFNKIILSLFAEIAVEYTDEQKPVELARQKLDAFRERALPNDSDISLYETKINDDYVDRGSYKLPAFLSKLAQTLTGDDNWNKDVTPDDVIYLGGGYWRCKAVLRNVAGEPIVVGFRLINPDRSVEELAVVTQAMNVLLS